MYFVSKEKRPVNRMKNIIIREPKIEDKENFLQAMQHSPLVKNNGFRYEGFSPRYLKINDEWRGHEYWANNPDPKRMFFVKGMPPYGEKRTHHVHIFEQDSDHWCNKLLFRDYLRLHPDVAKEYEQLKIKLAQEHLYDREKYTDEKLDFVNRVLQLAKKQQIISGTN